MFFWGVLKQLLVQGLLFFLPGSKPRIPLLPLGGLLRIPKASWWRASCIKTASRIYTSCLSWRPVLAAFLAYLIGFRPSLDRLFLGFSGGFRFLSLLGDAKVKGFCCVFLGFRSVWGFSVFPFSISGPSLSPFENDNFLMDGIVWVWAML